MLQGSKPLMPVFIAVNDVGLHIIVVETKVILYWNLLTEYSKYIIYCICHFIYCIITTACEVLYTLILLCFKQASKGHDNCQVMD